MHGECHSKIVDIVDKFFIAARESGFFMLGGLNFLRFLPAGEGQCGCAEPRHFSAKNRKKSFNFSTF